MLVTGRQPMRLDRLLVTVALGLTTMMVPAAGAAPRRAAIYYSNGAVVTGRVALTSGRRFKLNVLEAGKLSTTDMITGEDVRYGKVRQFAFDPVSEMLFHPVREEIRQDWKFVEKTKYNEKTAVADFSPAKKAFWGEAYPLRYLACEVRFNSGETLLGHLYSGVFYLETEEKTRRVILRSKQRGDKGTKMDDLVYITKIKMLDEGKEIAAELSVRFASMSLGPDDTVQAVTCQSLTPVPTERDAAGDSVVVKSTFGEAVYLAVKKGDRYLVGWPSAQDSKLFALARDHVERQRDFYNDKTLLGVVLSPDGRELLTLLNLRRQYAPTHFGSIGGEWDRQRNCIVEPWRLSIWRWKYDPVNQDLLLSQRGTFFREIFLPEQPTPTVELTDELWQPRLEGNTFIVEKTGADHP